MFYKTGVDITNDKQMFNFLKEHFVYPTLNAWNRCESIANKVKIYTLALSGNCWNALDHLNSGEYDTLSFMIQDWEREHPTYEVYFNGRSGGYLLSYNGAKIINYETKEAVVNQTLPPDVIPTLYDFAEEHDVGIISYEKGGVICGNGMDKYIALEAKINGISCDRII